MLDLMKSLLGKEETDTKQVAKERLKLVLMHDRMQISEEESQNMKEELLAVISKYLEIDEQGLEIDFEQEDDSMALVASIPVKDAKKSRRLTSDS